MTADNLLELLIEFKILGEDQAKKAQDILDRQKKTVAEIANDEVARSREIIAQKKQELEVLGQLKLKREEYAAAGRDTAELDATIKRLNTSLSGTGGHMNASRQNAMLFRQTLISIGSYIPGLENAFSAMMTSGNVATLGVIGALLALKDIMGSVNDVAAVQEATFTGNADAILAVEDATHKADIAARLFYEDLLRQNSAGSTAAEIAARTAGNYKNLITAQGELDAAQKSIGEAGIEAREKNGVITHKEALEEKFKLDVAYAQRKLQLDGWLHEQEENAKRQQLATEQQQLNAALADQQTDQATAKKAERDKARHDTQIDAAKQNAADARKTLDDLARPKGSIVKGEINDDNVQDLTAYYEKYIGDSNGVSLPDQFLKLQEAMRSVTNKASWDFGLTKLLDRDLGGQSVTGLAKYQGATQQLQNSKIELNRLAKSQFDVDLNAQRAAKQLAATDQAVQSLQASVNKLTTEIPQLVGDNKAKESNDAAAANLKLNAEAIKNAGEVGGYVPTNPLAPPPRAVATASWPGQPTGTYSEPKPKDPVQNYREIDGAARRNWDQLDAGMEVLGRGGKLDDRQQAMIGEILAAATGHAVRYDKFLEAFKKINSSNQARDIAFEKLKSELENTQFQFKNRN